MPLYWMNDPLLLDNIPIGYNTWETANSLIEQKGLVAVVQLDQSFTNLYGMLVRKVDFVRSSSRDRIIARFPFLVINTSLQEALLPHLLSLAEIVHHYFYKSIDKSILTWKKVISEYLDKGVLPLPIFRCAQEVLPDLSFTIVNDSLLLQSARGEAFTFPTKFSLSLAYLCGICNGDGNLRDYWVIIADENKQHIEQLSKQLAQLFNKKGNIMKTGGAWIVKLNLLWAVRLFNFLTQQTIDEPKYQTLVEPLILQKLSDDSFRKIYWRGVMDSDGSYSKYNICLSTGSKLFGQSFAQFLEQYNLQYTIYETTFEAMNTIGYTVLLLAISHVDFCTLIDSNHPRKKLQLEAILKRRYDQQRKGQIKDLRVERLTTNGSYDYNYLDDLRIQLTPPLVEQLYRNNTKVNLSISESTQTKYKTGQLTIPLSLVKELLQNNSYLDINLFLQQNAINTFHSGKSFAQLPFHPTKEITALLPFLKFRTNYIQIDFTNGIQNKFTLNSIQSLINNLFLISVSTTKIRNKVLMKFIQIFYEITEI